MTIVESVKSFLTAPSVVDKGETKLSSQVEPEQVLQDLTNTDIFSTGAFFDDNDKGIFGSSDKEDKLEAQKLKIMQYRNLAKTPDVSDAIEEIVNEISFSLYDKDPVKINVDEENDKIKDAIQDKFDKVMKLLNVKKNLYNIVKSAYVDGQIILHCAYNKNAKEGISSLKMVEPVYLYFDKKKDIYRYHTKRNSKFFVQSNVAKGQEYDIEEIVREDFGLKEDGINLGYLDYALKTANQLRTLEDLLIPMRFSRSISRRVFNVDIGDLPNKKGEQAMLEMQNKFKYKKFYNVESGEVTNQQHITSMVEDYWFANRSGGKGTQVDTIDETGNLGEINDILYFNKKLYKSMFIPSNRISINPDADQSFDYETTQVTKEDVKFFMFISRLRQVYTSLFKELIKREIISTGVMSETEYLEYEEKIEISFTNENTFIEKMNLDNFMRRLDIYTTAQEYAGKLFPVDKILKDVFKMSDEDIEENFKQIADEEKDPKYKKFYTIEGEEDAQW